MFRTKIENLFSHQGFKKYFKNTSWLMAEKVFRMLVGLFVGIWVARYLGPEQFGLLSYAQSFVGLFLAFSTLGLDGIVVRELVKNDSLRDKIIGSAFWLKLSGSAMLILMLFFAIQFTSNDTFLNSLIFIIASAAIFQSFNVIDFFFQSKVLGRYVAYANVISLFVSSVVKIFLILYEAPLIAFAWVVLFDSAILALGFIYFYSNHAALLKWTFDKAVAKDLLKDSWPLLLSSLVLMVQARIDQVMLKEMVGSTEVGFYSVALKIIEAFAFVPMVLKQSLYPSIVSVKSTSKQLYDNRLLNYYRLNFMMFLLMAVPIFFGAHQIILVLFGQEYESAGLLLSLMAIRLLFTNMGLAKGAYFITENLQMYSLLTMILGTITNVVLNYQLIPSYEAKGAIIATILSFFVTVFLVDVFYKKMHQNLRLMLKGIFTFYQLKLRS